MRTLVKPFQDLEKKHPKGDQVKRVVILMIYLLHHPSRQIDIKNHFKETLDKHPQLKNIPDNLKSVSNFNKDWQWLENNEIITPITSHNSKRNTIYVINTKKVFNTEALNLFQLSLISNIFTILNFASIKPEHTIFWINNIKKFDLLTFTSYLIKIFDIFKTVTFNGAIPQDPRTHYLNKKFLDLHYIDDHLTSHSILNRCLADKDNRYCEAIFDLRFDRREHELKTNEQKRIFEMCYPPNPNNVDSYFKILNNRISEDIKNNRCDYEPWLSEYITDFIIELMTKLEGEISMIVENERGTDTFIDPPPFII